jgi:hypothetical protein
MKSTLSGRVTVHGSKPATTAVVELHNSAGDVVTQTQVDDDGRYTFHISGGRWSLNVWDGHGHRGRGEIDIAEGETKSLDLDLEEPEGGH